MMRIGFIPLFICAILLLLQSGCHDMGPNPHQPVDTKIKIQNWVSSGGYKSLIRNVRIQEVSLSWPDELLYGAQSVLLTTPYRVPKGPVTISFEFTDSTGAWRGTTNSYTNGITEGSYNLIPVTRTGSTQTTVTLTNAVLVKGRACPIKGLRIDMIETKATIAYGQSTIVRLEKGLDKPFTISGLVQLPDGIWSPATWYGDKDILFGENTDYRLTGEKIVFTKCEVRVSNEVNLFTSPLPVRAVTIVEVNHTFSETLPYLGVTAPQFVTRWDNAVRVLFEAQLPHGEWVAMSNLYTGGINADSITTIRLTATPLDFATVQLLNRVEIDAFKPDLRKLAIGGCTWNAVLPSGQTSEQRILAARTTPVSITGEVLTPSAQWQAVSWSFDGGIKGGTNTIITLDNSTFSRIRFKNGVMLGTAPASIKELRMKSCSYPAILDYDSVSTFMFAEPQTAPVVVTGSVLFPNGGWKNVQWQLNTPIVKGKDTDLLLDGQSLPIARLEIRNSARFNLQPARIRNCIVRELNIAFDATLAPGERSTVALTPAYTGTVTIIGEIEKNLAFVPFQFIYQGGAPAGVLTTIDITTSIVEEAKIQIVNAVTLCGVTCAVNAVKCATLTWNTPLPYGSKSAVQLLPPVDTTLIISGMVQFNNQWIAAQWQRRLTALPGATVEIVLDSVVLNPFTFVQIRNELAIAGVSSPIRAIDLVGTSLRWNDQMAFGQTSTGLIAVPTAKNSELRFEYLQGSTWKKRWFVHESPLVAGVANVITIRETNVSVTTMAITNDITIDGYKCQIRNCRIDQNLWSETLPFGKTSDAKIVQPKSAPITVTGEVLIENSKWVSATWQLQQAIRQGENSEIILDGKQLTNRASVRFKNLCKEKITGGNYVYYLVRGLKCKQLYQSWSDETIDYEKISTAKPVEAGRYDSLVVEGEIKPQSSGSWVAGTWTFYKVTIDPNSLYQISLLVEENFRRRAPVALENPVLNK